MRITVLLVCFSIMSCGNNQVNPIVQPKGIWVENTEMTDTIEFTSNSTLSLRRGKEIINGQLLPKPASGPYSFEINGNEISLKWFLSSYSESNKYYFKQTNNIFDIGDFYEANLGSNILTFKKLD